MNSSMRRAWKISLTLHVVMLLALSIGLPNFSQREYGEPEAVSVEILTIADITNVMPSRKPVAQPKEAPKPPQTEAAAKEEPVEPTPEKVEKPIESKVKTADLSQIPPDTLAPAPKPPKPEPLPEPLPEIKKEPPPKPKKVEKKPDPKPQKPEVKQALKNIPLEKPKPKPPAPKKEEADPFKAIEKLTSKLEVKEPEPVPEEVVEPEAPKPELDFTALDDMLNETNKPYDARKPLTASQRDAIISIIQNKVGNEWNISVGMKNAKDMVILMRLRLNPDGTIKSIDPLDKERLKSDSLYKVAYRNAERAVRKSEPFNDLPHDLHDVKDGWKEVILRLDPKEYY